MGYDLVPNNSDLDQFYAASYVFRNILNVAYGIWEDAGISREAVDGAIFSAGGEEPHRGGFKGNDMQWMAAEPAARFGNALMDGLLDGSAVGGERVSAVILEAFGGERGEDYCAKRAYLRERVFAFGAFMASSEGFAIG